MNRRCVTPAPSSATARSSAMSATTGPRRLPPRTRRTRSSSSNGWTEYSHWHLGIDKQENAETKGAYSFPFGDFRRVHRSGVISGREPGGSVRPRRDPRRAEEAARPHRRGLNETSGPATTLGSALSSVWSQSRARDVARQRPSMPSSRTATARVRAGPCTIDDRLDHAVGGRGVARGQDRVDRALGRACRGRCARGRRGSIASRACGTDPR